MFQLVLDAAEQAKNSPGQRPGKVTHRKTNQLMACAGHAETPNVRVKPRIEYGGMV
jgi:hypothetical protein